MNTTYGQHVIGQARMFAFAAHGAIDQRRRYSGEPYIVHPGGVVELIKTACPGTDYKIIAAAWLHDVLEDTKIQASDLRYHFGGGVAEMVLELTDALPVLGNRATRKAINLTRLAAASYGAQTIKAADIMHNTPSIVQHDPNFAKIYLVEVAAILAVLDKADPKLRAAALQQNRFHTGEIGQ